MLEKQLVASLENMANNKETALHKILAESRGDPGNRYWPYDVLGEGAFGKVMVATDTHEHGKRVAIKSLHKEAITKESDLILGEIRNHKLCKHPNIVEFHKLYHFHGTFWMVMECVDGMDALDLMRKSTLPPESIAFISKEVLQALLYMHETLNIIHRDVKPPNVLVSFQGDIKLADFGVSIRASEEKKLGVGTRIFLAPETLRSTDYSFLVDIWSLGISVYVLAERKSPYSGLVKDGFEKYDLIKKNEHTPIISSAHPQNMRNFVHHCLLEVNKRPTAKRLLTHPWLSTSYTRNQMACLIQSINKKPMQDNYMDYYMGVILPQCKN